MSLYGNDIKEEMRDSFTKEITKLVMVTKTKTEKIAKEKTTTSTGEGSDGSVSSKTNGLKRKNGYNMFMQETMSTMDKSDKERREKSIEMWKQLTGAEQTTWKLKAEEYNKTNNIQI